MPKQYASIRNEIDGFALVTQGLSYAVAGKTLIDAIDLQLPSKGISVLMGQNGAGKSLLLRLLHGLLLPSSGAVQWQAEYAATKRHSMVFQKPILLRRSVRENLLFALGLVSRSHSQRCDELLTRVGLYEQRNQPARLLSGGEQQRLALARALANDPKVLLLDEATASLDPSSIKLIETIIKQCQAAGCKIIIVTHDVYQAQRLADDVVFMQRGEVCEHSSADIFFQQPVSPAAKRYLDGEIDE